MWQYWYIVEGVWLHIQYGFAAALVASLFELALPGEEKHTWKSRLRGIGFSMLYYMTAVAVILWLRRQLGALDIKPLLTVDLKGSIESQNIALKLIGYTLFPFAALLLHDFLYYWFHRMQHAVPFLWRFHRVHHSVRELNALNNYHHVSDEFFRIPFIMLPLLFLVDVQPPQVVFILFLIRYVAGMAHANTRFTFSIFKYVWVEPLYHRIHHSVEPRHWDRNFAAMFPVWDMVFGTAYYAKSREIVRTGLPDQDEPSSVKEYIFPPPVPGSRALPDTLAERA
jgi:sterol desaturase/sphingolipid hydroxylase (fatty acid hydroxylase superfamily)